jgi:hypothetical protein
MNKKIIIISMIILLSVLLFFGCVSGDKYNTYRLDGIPLNHETVFIFLSWIHTTDDDGSQELKVINNTNKIKSIIFDFSIVESILKNNNEKLIWGEPYTLCMYFPVYDAQKVIVNKLIFRSKNKVIDIRSNIGVSYLREKPYPEEEGWFGDLMNYRHYISLTEKELNDFRNSGTIDINTFNNENLIIERIEFVYDNVDVIFKKDRFFTLECDITFDSEIEGIEPENYSFVAKFNRIKYTGERMSLLLYLFLKNNFKI